MMTPHAGGADCRNRGCWSWRPNTARRRRAPRRGRAARTDGLLPHFGSPRAEKSGLGIFKLQIGAAGALWRFGGAGGNELFPVDKLVHHRDEDQRQHGRTPARGAQLPGCRQRSHRAGRPRGARHGRECSVIRLPDSVGRSLRAAGAPLVARDSPPPRVRGR